MSDAPKRIVIFGSAEIAQLTRYYLANDSDLDVVAFTVDDEFVENDQLDGLPLVPFSTVGQAYPPDTHRMVVALSYQKLNQLRQEKFEAVRANGYAMASYVCTRSVTWPDLTAGENCVILENQTIQPTVKIGDNVMIWSGNHIGHGSTIGDHTYIASHVVISGHCKIGQRCFLGVNATIRDFATIGDDCFVGMGATVTQDLADGSVVLSGSSQVYGPEDRRARALKRQYFGI